MNPGNPGARQREERGDEFFVRGCRGGVEPAAFGLREPGALGQGCGGASSGAFRGKDVDPGVEGDAFRLRFAQGRLQILGRPSIGFPGIGRLQGGTELREDSVEPEGGEPGKRVAPAAAGARFGRGEPDAAQREGAAQNAVRMGMLSLNQHHPDYLKLRVLVTLFGGYFGSRLMANIREQKGYTYGITAGLLPYPGEGVLTISSDTAPEYVQPLVQEVYKEMDRLCCERVPDEELDRVRSYMLGEMCRSYESVFSLSDAWIFIRISGLDKSYFTDILRAIETVTPDELRDLAQKYLCKENLKMVVCGKNFS